MRGQISERRGKNNSHQRHKEKIIRNAMENILPYGKKQKK
jgi:ribosomal protein L13